MFVKFLQSADIVLIHQLFAVQFPVFFLFLDEFIHTVESDAPVIPDNAPAAVRIGKSRDQPRVAGGAHFVGIDVKDAVVMRGLVFEFRFDEVGQFVAVCFARLPRHADPAEGIDSAL